jgi:hypothetical protein
MSDLMEIRSVVPKESTSPQVDWLAVRLEERRVGGKKEPIQKVIMLPAGTRVKLQPSGSGNAQRELFEIDDVWIDLDEDVSGCKASVRKPDEKWREDFENFENKDTSFLVSCAPTQPQTAQIIFSYDKNTAQEQMGSTPGQGSRKIVSGLVAINIDGATLFKLPAVTEVDANTLEPVLVREGQQATEFTLRPWYNPRGGSNYIEFSRRAATWYRIFLPGKLEPMRGFALHLGRYTLGCISLIPEKAQQNWDQIVRALSDCRSQGGVATLQVVESSSPGVPILRFPRELTLKRPSRQIPAHARTFFTISYLSPDPAQDEFQRAAKQWEIDIKLKEEFKDGIDQFVQLNATTKDEFFAAWNSLTARPHVWCGQIFTRAMKQYPPSAAVMSIGLEFQPSHPGQSPVLQKSEIEGLAKLNWDSDASFLILAGCNTGRTTVHAPDPTGEMTLYSPAHSFAVRQNVLVLGQDGYSHFSKSWENYAAIAAGDDNIVLWSYHQGRNSAFNAQNWRRRTPGVIYSASGLPKLNLQKLPDIMRANNLPKGAELMERWFSLDASVNPNFAEQNDTIISMAWLLGDGMQNGFERVKQLHKEIFDDRIWEDSKARVDLLKVLRRKGLLRSTPTTFAIPAGSGLVVDPDYFQRRDLSFYAAYSELDDLTAAMARFNFRLVAGGRVDPVGNDHRVTIDEIGIYVRDQYEFEDWQPPLGFWDDTNNSVSRNPLAGVPVFNHHFRDWREATGKGGDMEIFTDVQRHAINPGYSFLASEQNYQNQPNLSAWRKLLSFRPSTAVQKLVQNRGDSWTVHRVEDGSGWLNLDYYPVEVTVLPTVNGVQWQPARLLEYVRTNINDFVDLNITVFEPWMNRDAQLWNSGQAVGSVLMLEIILTNSLGVKVIDWAPVVTSQHETNEWRFSTVRGGSGWNAINDRNKPGAHPVSGNRAFGFVPSSEGPWTFYTLGADRATRPMDQFWGVPWANEFGFRKADELWRAFQQKLTDFVNANAGQARVKTEETHSNRYDWEQVRHDSSVYNTLGQPPWVAIPIE